MFSLRHLRTLRLAEIDDVERALPPGARVLEIGAGTGEQAAELARRGFDVRAIDLGSSNYKENQVFEVIDYDGVSIPFPDDTFDVVYSSNVLEHVIELETLQREIHRVLRADGRCVHLLPTPAWRLWSALSVFASAAQAAGLLFMALANRPGEGLSYTAGLRIAVRRLGGQVLEAVRQPRHGERGNRLTELFFFSRRWWVRHFEQTGFRVLEQRPAGLFYTGYMVLGARLSIARRKQIAGWLGSACHWFVLDVAPTCQCVAISCDDGKLENGPTNLVG